MAIREKAGMWCPTCKRPVAGRRNGHAVRNAGGLLAAIPTIGLSLVAAKTEPWHCPICGGNVRRGGRGRVPLDPDRLPAIGSTVLTLVEPGPNRLATLKVYRRITRASLRSAEAALDACPSIIGSFEEDKAKALALEFSRAGAPASTSSSP